MSPAPPRAARAPPAYPRPGTPFVGKENPESNPEPNSRGVYTGEYRASFRERIQRLRALKPAPRPVPLDNFVTSNRTPPSTTREPRTPTKPTPSLECPGAPRKDREANERSRRIVNPCLVSSRGWGCGRPEPPMFPDLNQQSGHVIPGRRSPLRNTWNPGDLDRAVADLVPLIATSDEDVKEIQMKMGNLRLVED
ncbi:hypothetical protein GGR58DRAFT_528734 [Xylaria digitata]|nr:hypothetical protein GGR58DRAFT_528734 [Xylaria digitata]